MDRRNNTRNKGRPCGGPQGRPTPPPTYHQLQNQLNSAHEYIDELKMKVRSLEENKSQPQVTTENCNTVPKKVQVGRLEELLVTRATDFRQEICHLKKTIQLEKDKYNEMVDKYEAEKEKVQGKVKQHLNLIIERGYEIVDLNSSIDSLTQTLKEKVFELNTNEAELQQSKKTWSAKCTALEDRFTKDLAEKEESWEIRFNTLQTMCNSLQENLKMEQVKNKDWQKKAKQMEEEKKEQEEKFIKDLAEKQQSWEIKDKQMEEEKKELEEKFTKDLAVKQRSWEIKAKQMEEREEGTRRKFTKDRL
ncbi:microtubule-associated protein 1A-like [Etheostoma spectabile]|uniref:microtubule-associated protein 1A-like n=1 Tax=Etheostoma spectabile TaxID=54343 RepID=UPI0013AF1E5D|nr:microtubule-associated protein 1A-like [Etheostoma spectabile]